MAALRAHNADKLADNMTLIASPATQTGAGHSFAGAHSLASL